MPKKISIFTASLNIGGAERAMVTLANSFVKFGYSVDFVIINRTGKLIEELNCNVNVVSLNSYKTITSLFSFSKYLSKTKPDVILSTLPTINIIAVLSTLLLNINSKLFVRISITVSSSESDKRIFGNSIIFLLRRFALRHTKHIIAPSEGVANDLINNLGINKKIHIINNPIDFEKIEKLKMEKVIPHPLINSKPIILSVGRFDEQKDFPTLLKAFSNVVKEKDAVLIILGEGDEKEKLEKLIVELNLNDKVIMPGFVNNPYSYMQISSVFVLSSKYEGLPNVLLQAQAVSLPIVSTDCPSGPREILEDGRWGYLVSIGDYNNLAIGILKGLNGELVIPNKKYVQNKYDSDIIAQKYLETFFN